MAIQHNLPSHVYDAYLAEPRRIRLLGSSHPGSCAAPFYADNAQAPGLFTFSNLYAPHNMQRDLLHAACVALEAILVPLRGRSMHGRASEVRRIPLPRTPVNRGV